MTTVFVIDVETTGIEPATERVVELATVPVRLPAAAGGPLEIGEPWSTLVFPGIPIPPTASAVHHLIDEDVVDAMSLDMAIGYAFGEDGIGPEDICAAHNARFDRSFLPTLHSFRWIDTYRCALHVWPDAPGHSNQALRYVLKIDVPRDLPVHRALGDAIVTAHLLVRLLEERSVEELLTLSTKAVVLKKVGFGMHFGKAWADVPTSYLEWLDKQISDDVDVRFTTKTELARRQAAKKLEKKPDEQSVLGPF